MSLLDLVKNSSKSFFFISSLVSSLVKTLKELINSFFSLSILYSSVSGANAGSSPMKEPFIKLPFTADVLLCDFFNFSGLNEFN